MSDPITISRRIPARTETFEVLWIRREFMEMSPKYREIRSALRNKMDKCWWCHRPLEDGEMMGLVAIKGKTNKIFCQGCLAEFGDRP